MQAFLLPVSNIRNFGCLSGIPDFLEKTDILKLKTLGDARRGFF